jgi:hypothetical protein
MNVSFLLTVPVQGDTDQRQLMAHTCLLSRRAALNIHLPVEHGSKAYFICAVVSRWLNFNAVE